MNLGQSKNTHVAAGAQHREDANIAVVGGGLAGLAAAAYLARAGRKVTVFEKAGEIGGRAASQDHNGFIFNLGAHALYAKSPAVEVLKELGVDYKGGNPVGVQCRSDGKFCVSPVDPVTLVRSPLFSAAEKWEASRLLLKLQFADPAALASISFSDWLDKEARHLVVRRYLESSVRTATYTNSPQQLSMDTVVEQVKQVASGKVIYVDGGWQTLVNGLRKVAQEAGAQIVTELRVEAVEYSGGSVAGVRLANGTFHSASAVIIAAGPKDAAQLVGTASNNPALQEWTERVKSLVPVHAACLDVALNRLPQPQNRVVLDLDGPHFLTVQSEFSKIAPDGKVLLHTLKYIDPTQRPDADADKRELEAWLDEAQPGWRQEVIERRFLPHMIVSNALVSVAGGGLAGRLDSAVPGVHNLFVAGDWIGPKAAIASATLLSAKLASQAVLANSVDAVLARAA